MMSLQAIDLGAGSGKPYMVLAGNQRALYDNRLNNLAPRQWESGQGQRIGDIPSPAQSAMLEYYPNPASDNLTIVVPNPARLNIYSIFGILVYNSEIQSGFNTISLHGLIPGMYLLEVINADEERCIGNFIVAK